MEKLQNRIKSTRQSLGLSQAELAELTGVSQPTVANWENGSHVPRSAVLDRISQALNVNAGWLLAGARQEDEIPAHVYLQTPIRHVPVFEWPSRDFELSSAAPMGYIPHASQTEGLFGIIDRDEESYHILICNPRSKPSQRDGEFIVASKDKVARLSRSNIGTERCLGRIVAQLTYYP